METRARRKFRMVMALGLAGLGGACSAIESVVPAAFTQKTSQSDDSANKIVRLPMTSEDLDCPIVEVQDGGATARVGGPENSAVRYQFDIADTARECHPQGGNQFDVKVGVSGHLLIGPAGSPGAYSTTLRVVVRREVDKKDVFTKSYRIEANASGAAEAPYQLVTEPIVLPMTRPNLNLDYSILVGFDSGRVAQSTHPRHRRKAQ